MTKVSHWMHRYGVVSDGRRSLHWTEDAHPRR